MMRLHQEVITNKSAIHHLDVPASVYYLFSETNYRSRWSKPMQFETTMSVRAICLVAISMAFQGCIVVPLPQPPSEHAVLIEVAEIASIEPGQSHRKDVYQRFGLPGFSFDGGSRWLFVTKSHRAGGVRVCGGVLDPFSVLDAPNDMDQWEGSGACSEKSDIRVHTYLDVEFDAAGIVVRSQLTLPQKGGCAQASVCLDPDSKLVVIGSADADARAKSFQTKPDQCAVFLYSMNSSNPTRIRVGERRQTQYLHSGSAFMRFDLDVGLQKFDLSYSRKMKLQSEAIEIECVAENSYFIRRQPAQNSEPTFTTVSPVEGKPQILERYLTLARDGG